LRAPNPKTTLRFQFTHTCPVFPACAGPVPVRFLGFQAFAQALFTARGISRPPPTPAAEPRTPVPKPLPRKPPARLPPLPPSPLRSCTMHPMVTHAAQSRVERAHDLPAHMPACCTERTSHEGAMARPWRSLVNAQTLIPKPQVLHWAVLCRGGKEAWPIRITAMHCRRALIVGLQSLVPSLHGVAMHITPSMPSLGRQGIPFLTSIELNAPA
jgi:hypothetical protein